MSDNQDKKFNQNNYESFKSVGFFSAGDHFHYAFKKTEKIVHALYLVTNHLKDNEPLKLELRERSLSLLSIVLEFNSPDLVNEQTLLSSFFSCVFEILPFITTASVSGSISYTNADLIIRELEALMLFLKERTAQKALENGLILSRDFFAATVDGIDQKLPVNKVKNPPAEPTHLLVRDKKNSRQKVMIDLLKKQSHLTIKDFTQVVLGCSEKTIQRELNDLVEKGVVVKEGERRWSKYSLK